MIFNGELKIYSIEEFQRLNPCWNSLIKAPTILEFKIILARLESSRDFNIFDVAIPSGNFNFFSTINVFLKGIVNKAPKIPPIKAILVTSI